MEFPGPQPPVIPVSPAEKVERWVRGLSPRAATSIVATVVLVSALWWGLFIKPSTVGPAWLPSANADTFAATGPGIGLPHGDVGSTFFCMGPTLSNDTDRTVTLRNLRPVHVPNGVSFDGVVMYKSDHNHPANVTGWSDTTDNPAADPRTAPTQLTFNGTVLKPNFIVADEVMLQYTIRDTPAYPVTIGNLELTYERSGFTLQQTIETSCSIRQP